MKTTRKNNKNIYFLLLFVGLHRRILHRRTGEQERFQNAGAKHKPLLWPKPTDHKHGGPSGPAELGRSGPFSGCHQRRKGKALKLKLVLSFMLPFHNFLLSESGCATVFFNDDNYISCAKFISTIPNQKQSEATEHREGTSLLVLLICCCFLTLHQVFIIGHVPPGFFEKKRNKPWFTQKFNTVYLDLIKKHHSVVMGQFFGHHHTDSFRMFYDSEGKILSGDGCKAAAYWETVEIIDDSCVSAGAPINTMFLSPGVTPWKTTLPGVKDGANNPGIRIFEYDTQTLLVKVSQQKPLYSWIIFYDFFLDGCSRLRKTLHSFWILLFC